MLGVADFVYAAAITSAGLVCVATLPVVITSRQRRSEAEEQDVRHAKEREQDQEDRERVAARQEAQVAEAQRKADLVATKLLAANERVAQTTALHGLKLDQISGLVDGNVTGMIENMVDVHHTNLALLEENVRLLNNAGVEPTDGTVAIIAATKLKIAQLEAQLVARHEIMEDAARKREAVVGHEGTEE